MTTIALIDDHKIFCDSLGSLINDFEGYSISWCAHDGAKAIQLLENEQQTPDIILLDIKLPVMSELEVAKWLFENKKEIKVLALNTAEKLHRVRNVTKEKLFPCLLCMVKMIVSFYKKQKQWHGNGLVIT